MSPVLRDARRHDWLLVWVRNDRKRALKPHGEGAEAGQRSGRFGCGLDSGLVIRAAPGERTVPEASPRGEDLRALSAVHLRGRKHSQHRVRMAFLEPGEERVREGASVLDPGELDRILGLGLENGEERFDLELHPGGSLETA